MHVGKKQFPQSREKCTGFYRRRSPAFLILLLTVYEPGRSNSSAYDDADDGSRSEGRSLITEALRISRVNLSHVELFIYSI